MDFSSIIKILGDILPYFLNYGILGVIGIIFFIWVIKFLFFDKKKTETISKEDFDKLNKEMESLKQNINTLQNNFEKLSKQTSMLKRVVMFDDEFDTKDMIEEVYNGQENNTRPI